MTFKPPDEGGGPSTDAADERLQVSARQATIAVIDAKKQIEDVAKDTIEKIREAETDFLHTIVRQAQIRVPLAWIIAINCLVALGAILVTLAVTGAFAGENVTILPTVVKED